LGLTAHGYFIPFSIEIVHLRFPFSIFHPPPESKFLTGTGVGLGVGFGVGFGVGINSPVNFHLCRPLLSSLIHRSTLVPAEFVLKYFRFPLTPPATMML